MHTKAILALSAEKESKLKEMSASVLEGKGYQYSESYQAADYCWNSKADGECSEEDRDRTDKKCVG